VRINLDKKHKKYGKGRETGYWFASKYFYSRYKIAKTKRKNNRC